MEPLQSRKSCGGSVLLFRRWNIEPKMEEIMRTDTTLSAPAPCGAKAYNFAAIDYTRLVMTFIVMAAHCRALSCFGEPVHYYAQELFGRLAVPFFFFCTGYFALGSGRDPAAVQRGLLARVKKMLYIYVYWTLLYVPLAIFEYLHVEKQSVAQALAKFVHEFFFTGSFYHLWYINSAAFALFLLWCCLRRRLSWRTILLLSAVLYCAGLSFSSWYLLVRRLPFWDIPVIYTPTKLFLQIIIRPNDGLLFGFPFVAFSAYLSQRQIPSRKVCRVGFLLSMMAGAAEVIYIRYLGLGGPFPDSSLYCFLPFAATFLFCGLLQIPAAKQVETRNLRKISALMYFVHKWFIELYRIPHKIFGGVCPLLIENSLFKYIVVAALSFAFAAAAVRLAEEKRFAWLKRLF